MTTKDTNGIVSPKETKRTEDPDDSATTKEAKKTEGSRVAASPKEIKKPEYPQLPLRGFGKLSPEEYVEERINPEMKYYSKAATKSKQRYLQMRAITVVGGALVPVLVNVDSQYVDLLTTALSLMVVLFVSLETVYRFREQWTNYRTAEQNLRNEYFLFTSESGDYAGLDKDDAFTLFVNRVEQAIEAESASTLRVMTTITESKASSGTPAAAATKA